MKTGTSLINLNSEKLMSSKYYYIYIYTHTFKNIPNKNDNHSDRKKDRPDTMKISKAM